MGVSLSVGTEVLVRVQTGLGLKELSITGVYISKGLLGHQASRVLQMRDLRSVKVGRQFLLVVLVVRRHACFLIYSLLVGGRDDSLVELGLRLIRRVF